MRQSQIAFVSPHCLVDFTNGAATATLDALALLATVGFNCQAFCNTRIDGWDEVLVEEILARRGAPYHVRNAQIGKYQGRMLFTIHGPVEVTLFNSASTRGRWINPDEIGAFLTGCELFLRKNRPDVVWTYGGDPVSLLLHKIVRGLGIPLLFSLHNFAYLDRSIFAANDRVVVPTRFAQQFYRELIGLETEVLPLVMNEKRVKSTERGAGSTGFVTFINPEPRKGVHVFARIADVLARRRPDIPLLLVEGAAKQRFLQALGVDLSGLKNLTIWPNTPDARKFYAVSKVILMPSLMENAGYVAMEAMTNGIPVIASNRGGLPETIGDAAPTIDIPARYTTETRDIPAEEEVEAWIETITRLWDDADEYGRWSRAALRRSEAWSPAAMEATYVDFFRGVAEQSGTRRAAPAFAARRNIEPSGQLAPKPYVTCKWLGQSGRFGNQLFQIAATIGVARRNNLEFVFPVWRYANHFQRCIPQSPAIPSVESYAEPSFAYREIRVCRPTDLAGCWQSERYFKHCEAEVRSYFAPRPELLAALKQRFGKLLERPTCSVHVRRGDYAKLPEYADLAATDYYEQAIARFPKETTFLFFSDDIPWCQQRFRDRRFAFIAGQSDVQDLFLMSLCSGHIIANSTFSWWGAWLDPRASKTVVAPSRWFAGSYADPSLPFSSQPYQGYHDASDIIPASWNKL